ncbi:MAG TPA: VIT domain-containing protein, partial [Enhygromyxa sp.]|nr:VIT domain-containing protein [Enhygromyxa sp.]
MTFSFLLLLAWVVIGCTEARRTRGPEPARLVRGAELEPAARMPDERPIRMTSRDGTDLPLVSLEVRGTVEDPLAFTELHLEFENPEPRPLDATLEVELPPLARVTRFAALIDGVWREAEVVERKSGSLQPSLYEPAEPAVDPNPDGDQRFVVTLPGVPGRSMTSLRLAYAETFPDADQPYRVRVAGLHDVPRFSASVVVRSQPDPLLEVWAGNRLPEQLGMDEHGRRFLEIRRLDWTATEDFVVPTSGLRRTGVRNGRKVAVRINPLTHDHAAPIEGLTILFDTSASRAVGYAHRVEQLAGLIEALQPWTGNELWLRLIAFDQGFETVYEGPLGEIERSAFDRLLARHALGASNLVSVLRHAGKPIAHASNRVILISDGMATAGVSERSALLDSVADLREAGVQRIDVVADDGRRDLWTLRDMVRKLPESGLVLDAADNPRQLVRRLLRTVHDDVRISVPGARWSYPEIVHGMQSDDELLVFADIEDVDGGLPIIVESHGKQRWVVPLVEVEEPLVGWALENARVELLIATLVDKSLRRSATDGAEIQPLAARKQLWRRIVSSSKQNRIINDYTCLSMLADADDYERAKVDLADLPEILVAGPIGVEERTRQAPHVLAAANESSASEAPLTRSRQPVFPSETLGVDQLLLLAREDGSSGPSGLSSAEADAVMAVGELLEEGALPLPTPLPEVELPDSPQAELARMLRAKPLEGRRSGRPRTHPPQRKPDDAYQGNLLTIMNLIEWGDVAEAKQVAWRWREAEPTEVLAVVALGEALEANAEIEAAARAYGSIIDMFPDRADMRRFAGSRLEHLGSVGTRLAIDTYRRARQSRADAAEVLEPRAREATHVRAIGEHVDDRSVGPRRRLD